MPESTAAQVEKPRGDRQQTQPCNASPRLDLALVGTRPSETRIHHCHEVILATGRQGSSRPSRLMGWDPVHCHAGGQAIGRPWHRGRDRSDGRLFGRPINGDRGGYLGYATWRKYLKLAQGYTAAQPDGIVSYEDLNL